MIPLKDILPVTAVKRHLMQILQQLGHDSPIVITKNGKAAGVLMSPDDFESLAETSEVLHDKKLLKSLKKAENDVKKGLIYSHAQVFKE